MTTPSYLEQLFSLQDKIVLLTGASGGIGQELAVALAKAGAAVSVHGRAEERVMRTCQQIEDVGGQSLALLGDLANVEICQQLVDQTVEKMGGLDVLINCAATNRRKPIVEATVDDFDTIVSVNLRSGYFLSQAAYPIMRDHGGGKIIHIASMTVFFGLDTVSVYGLSKAGVAQMAKTMAVEWARDNIQVNCITPGFFLTPLSQPLWNDDDKSRWFRSRLPMRRPGNPDELVGAMLLLASPASSYITGQNIVVDWGFQAGGSWHRDNEVFEA